MKIKISDLGKPVFFVFMLYVSWYRETFGINQIFLYGPAVLLTMLVFAQCMMDRIISIKVIPSFIKTCFVLILYSIATGLFVAVNKDWCYSSIMTFFAYVIVCFDVYYISQENGSYEWIMNTLVVCGIICSLQTIFAGYRYWTSGVYAITLGVDNNPNYLGLVIIISMFALLYDIHRVKKHFLVTLALVALFTVVIIRTASRKNVMCLAILILMWFIWTMRSFFEDGEGVLSVSRRNFLYLVLIISGAVIGLFFIYNRFSASAVFEKFTKTAETGEGLSSRMFLYKEAWEMFKEHPILGVGFDQYRFHASYGKYSHSTYAEILSCTGIVGAILFFLPLFRTYFKVVKTALQTRFRDYRTTMILLMFSIELLLGIGQIYIYEFYHLLVLLLLFINIEREDFQSSEDYK